MGESEKRSGLSRFIEISGASATVTILALILYAVKIIPNEISLAIAFFVSLPLVYSFIFGIILNKPNFQSVVRHYSFTAYILLALAIYMVILKPDSVVEGVKYLFFFVLGLVLAGIGYSTYSLSYKISSKKVDKYRWRALISFGASFIITLIIAFVLNHYGVFNLI